MPENGTATATAKKPSYAELQAQLETMQAKLAAKQQIKFKVSEKGAVSVYGLNSRFPVTLYGGQWDRLLAKSDELKAFLVANKANLATKDA